MFVKFILSDEKWYGVLKYREQLFNMIDANETIKNNDRDSIWKMKYRNKQTTIY